LIFPADPPLELSADLKMISPSETGSPSKVTVPDTSTVFGPLAPQPTATTNPNAAISATILRLLIESDLSKSQAQSMNVQTGFYNRSRLSGEVVKTISRSSVRISDTSTRRKRANPRRKSTAPA
jgi:hypothetical protein